MSRFRRLAGRDEGVALVVALAITLIVFVITTAILADAFHNVVGSANSRARLSAINAAEAGIDAYSAVLENSSIDKLTTAPWTGSGNTWTTNWSTPTNWPDTNGQVVGIPSLASYVIKAEYFADAALAQPLSPGTYTDKTFPPELWVRLTSTGSVPRGCAAGAAGCVRRTMQSVLQMRSVRANLRGAFAGMFICEMGNRFSVTGSYADLYFIGRDPVGIAPDCPSNPDSLFVNSGQLSTAGSVYVLRGSVTLQRSVKIDGNLWAKGDLTINAGGPQNGGNGKCAWTTSGQVLICGNASSGTYISINPPTSVLGTASVCGNCGPPQPDFPKITWADDYSGTPNLLNPSAAQLKTLLTTPSASAQVVFIKSCAAATALPTGTLRMQGDITIVSDCGYTFSNRVDIRAVAGYRPKLSLITVFPASGSCSVASDARDITLQQNFDASAITFFAYTPCTLRFANQVNITGQLVAGRLIATGRTTINTVDLSLTGEKPGPIGGFQQRMLWIREI